ncbi:MAG: phosphoglycerate kinase [Candidatus Anstonellales archaeon]
MNLLDNYDFRGKRVFVRPDLNCPIDEKTGRVEKSPRVIEHAKTTILELSEKGAKVIVLAHQGRKGEPDCVSLNQHAKFLEEETGKRVIFVPDVCGHMAKKAISNLKNGEILLLENVRFLDDETAFRTPQEYSKSSLVKNLLPFCDAFVLDGFSVSHRAQASVIGFISKPTFAGRVMEKELAALSHLKNPLRPCTFILGGAKPEDSIPILEHWLSQKKADYFLCGGVLGLLILLASGVNLGKTKRYMEEKNHTKHIPLIRGLLEKYQKHIKLPLDVAYDKNGQRHECPTSSLPIPHDIYDIGTDTQSEFSSLIKRSKTIIINGPLGVYENNEFAKGTRAVLEAIASTNSFSIVGGGHTLSAIEKFEIDKKKFSYISLAGKALVEYLSGKSLPGLEILRKHK